MEWMSAWWGGLTPLNQWFYIAAAFFSVFFFWQLLAGLFGLAGDHDVDTSVESTDAHDVPPDAHDTLAVFRMLSIRSVLAFFTLFSWAGALYLNDGYASGRAIGIAAIWGIGAMVIVSLLLRFMRKMTDSGTMSLESCVGTPGTVYLDIPAGGQGEVRVLCSGSVTLLKARAADGSALKAGAAVTVTRMAGPDVVEVTVASQGNGGAK
jgi:hypothetical protein